MFTTLTRTFTRTAALCMIAVFIAAGSASVASAKTTSFVKPKWNGDRLDWCVNWAQGCGQQAATAFCKAKGYNNATAFSMDPNIGAVQRTRLIGTGAVCDQGFCDGFKAVTCFKPNPVAYFSKPKWNGDRLDWCVNWAQGCGKAAADAFCKAKGFVQAGGFSMDPDIGAVQRTRLIATGAVCDQGFCDGFKGITCKN
jgi:hypothetical protein